MTRPVTRAEIVSMIRTARQAAQTTAEDALTAQLAEAMEWALESGRQEGRAAAFAEAADFLEKSTNIAGAAWAERVRGLR